METKGIVNSLFGKTYIKFPLWKRGLGGFKSLMISFHEKKFINQRVFGGKK